MILKNSSLTSKELIEYNSYRNFKYIWVYAVSNKQGKKLTLIKDMSGVYRKKILCRNFIRKDIYYI
jgi:hypothetical protein